MNYNKAVFENAYGVLSQLPESDEPEVVFAGRSNVGKSSLLNKLFNRKNLARVSSVPGKTITINFYDVDNIKFVGLRIRQNKQARVKAIWRTYGRVF